MTNSAQWGRVGENSLYVHKFGLIYNVPKEIQVCHFFFYYIGTAYENIANLHYKALAYNGISILLLLKAPALVVFSKALST